jgi:hypothetical protein
MPSHDTLPRLRMGRPPIVRPFCPICGVNRLKTGRNPYCSKACSNRARAVPALDRFVGSIGSSRTDLPLSFEMFCRDWQGDIRGDGYGAFPLTHDRQVGAHRYAYAIAAGLNPMTLSPSLSVAHTCDRVLCVQTDGEGVYEVRGVTYQRFGHLYATTPAGNTHDKIDKGRARHVRGEQHPSAKLTDAQVESLCDDWARGATQDSLAEKYGIVQSQVSRLVHRTRRSSP